MRKYLYGLLTGLVLMAGLSYAGNLIPEPGGTLVSEYFKASKGIIVHGAGSAYNPFDNDTLQILGKFTSPSGSNGWFTFMDSTHIVNNQSAGNVVAMELDPILENTAATANQMGLYTGYPSFRNTGGGSVTDMVSMYASYGGYSNNGAVSRINGLVIDYQGIAAETNPPAQIWGIRIPGGDQAGGNINGIKNNLPGHVIIGESSLDVAASPKPSLNFNSVTFANMPAPNIDGVLVYCSDCNPANCTAGGSTGSFCKRQGGAWLPM